MTVLDTHDGIGVIDVGADASDPKNSPGLLAPSQIDELVETMHERSNGQSRKATGAAASNLDLYQVNCTYYDALGRRDLDYLIARAIQFWAPGVPQVYYVGALGGTNDMELLSRSGVGRDINRHHYAPAEITSALQKPMVRSLISLIRFRNSHAPSTVNSRLNRLLATRSPLLGARATNGPRSMWISPNRRPSLAYTSGSAIKRHELSPVTNSEIAL